jgi:hypothetical protein
MATKKKKSSRRRQLGQTPRQAAYAKTRARVADESTAALDEIDGDLRAYRCMTASVKIHELTLATGKRCGMLTSCALPIIQRLRRQAARVVDCVNRQPSE